MENTDRNDFCILHHIEGDQVLIDTTFNHDTDNFELTLKFWFEKVNGYTSIKLEWPGEREGDFIRTFEEMKDVEEVKRWIAGVKAKFFKS